MDEGMDEGNGNPGLRKGDLKHLLVDTGAILAGEHLAITADNYWTVDEVLLEGRDKHSRERLANLRSRQ